jgi:long-subunit acyl-CoA synthetase (AMP-forming)
MDGVIPCESLFLRGLDVPPKDLERAEKAVQAEDVCSLQFTSGTTGKPKVAMLTHR